jgi:hypothetical protein
MATTVSISPLATMARSASGVSMPLGLFIVLPVEHKDFPDLLHGLGPGLLADCG